MRGDTEFHMWREHLERARENWSTAPKELKPHLLLAEQDLVEAEGWLHVRRQDLTPQQQNFIVKSIANRLTGTTRAKEAARRKWGERLSWGFDFMTIIAVVGAVYMLEYALLQAWRNSASQHEAEQHQQQVIPAAVRQEMAEIEEIEKRSMAERREDMRRRAELERRMDAAKHSASFARLSEEHLAKGEHDAALLLALESVTSARAAQGGYGAEFEAKALLSAASTLLRALRTERTVDLAGSPSGEHAFAGNGRFIFSAMADNGLGILDASSGKRLALISGHGDKLFSAALDTGRVRVAMASGEDAARTWDVGLGKEMARLWGHEGPVLATSFSSDGTRVVTASQDATARLWDAATGRQLIVLRGHEDAVLAAAISPDGSRIATASQDQTARLWDAASGKAIAVLKEHQGPVTQSIFSDDGSRVLTASWDGTARLWDGATGKPIAKLATDSAILKTATFARGGKAILTTAEDGSLALWNAADGALSVAFAQRPAELKNAALSADGHWLATTTWNGSAYLWDARQGTLLSEIGREGEEVAALSFSADGRTLTGLGRAEKIQVWPVGTLDELVERARGAVGRCLSVAERLKLGLRDATPEWCEALGKSVKELAPTSASPTGPESGHGTVKR
jgi:hypothetical protein